MQHPRQAHFYTDAARAFAALRGKERDAIRYLLVAERLAPQHVHSSALVLKTARALLHQSRSQGSDAALRGLC
jgi:hypothetical protein